MHPSDIHIAVILAESASGWANVVEQDGIGISITGMSIVFVALVLISVFIAALPKILGLLGDYLPEQSHGLQHSHSELEVSEEEEIVAALGFVMHERRQK